MDDFNNQNCKFTYIDIYNKLSQMFPNACCELIYHNLYELCIAVMLSAQTTDEAVNKITPALFKKYPDLYSLSNADIDDVMTLIKRIGLYQNKAKNIINFAKKVLSDFKEIPNEFDKLVTLPGIGRKTANVILSEWFKIPRIAVDTHVLRVSNRLNLSISKDPLKVERDLMDKYPEEIWSDLHLKLLFFGRYFCKAKKPNCENCFYKEFCFDKIK